MASRCSSLSSLPWLLLLVVVLGDAVAATAMPRPLLGIAEPPAIAPGTAAGPAGASQPGGGRRPDRSVAGAEVILAGFAAAVMVTIFCYIRVTRKNSGSSGGGSGSSSSSDVGVGLGSGGKQQQGL